MSRPIRICFLIQHLSIGGIETRLLKLLRAIDRKRFDPVVICARDDGIQSEAFKKLGFPIISTTGLLPVNRIRQLIEVFRLMARFGFRRFDCMMSFLPTSQPFENIFALIGVKRLAFAFCLVVNFRMGRDKDWDLRGKLAKAIVSVSKGSAAEIFGASPAIKKVHVIPNGVDVELFNKSRYPNARAELGLPDTPFLISCIARLAPQKRYDVLLEALALLRIRGIQFHCVIAGQDKLNGWLGRRLSELDLEEHVTYVGASNEVPKLLAASDALALTSDNEGCPNAVLEAMATGIPVVVTKSGSEEFVVEGVTGYVVPLGDATAVADRLQQLAGSSHLRAAIGGNARSWISSNASLDKMLDSYFKLFEELVNKATVR